MRNTRVQKEPLWSMPGQLQGRIQTPGKNKEYSNFLFCGFYSAVAVFFLLVFGISAWVEEQFTFSYILLGFAFVTTFSYMLIWLVGYYFLAKHLMVFLMGSLCLYLFYTGGTENTGPIFYFIFPLVTIFLQGYMVGIFSVLFLVFCTWAMEYFALFGFDQERYSFVYVTRFGAVYFIISILTLIFYYIKEKAEFELMLSKGDVQQLTFNDELTGVANRTLLDRMLFIEHTRFVRYGTEFCILLLQIDSFKQLPLRYGSTYGEYVLKTLTMLINTICRAPDIPGRCEDDVFMVILPGTSLKDASLVAERLRIAIEQHEFSYRSVNQKLTLSIGLQEAIPEDVSEMLIKADQHLYTALKKGGNTVVSSA